MIHGAVIWTYVVCYWTVEGNGGICWKTKPTQGEHANATHTYRQCAATAPPATALTDSHSVQWSPMTFHAHATLKLHKLRWSAGLKPARKFAKFVVLSHRKGNLDSVAILKMTPFQNFLVYVKNRFKVYRRYFCLSSPCAALQDIWCVCEKLKQKWLKKGKSK